MNRYLLLCVFCFIPAFIFSQVYSPIAITGFNKDVIAEGTGTSSLSTTTREMDALVPSNYIIVTKQFAASNSIPSTYGLPDNGTITSGSKTYQMESFGNGTTLNNNVLLLMKNAVGILTFSTPAAYSNISLLGTATEGQATINIKVNYTDGTNQFFTNKTYDDWIGGANPVIVGFGRVKRQNGPFPASSYEKSPTDPRLYAIDLTVSCSKMIKSLLVSNISSGTDSSNRAFIFAISGAQTLIPQGPLVAPVTICPNLTATLSVQSPLSTLTYNWYTAAVGGTAVFTGTTYTTPVLTATTTYYVQAVNSGGCVSTRTPVTVTVDPQITQPIVPPATICSGQTTTLTITNPEAGVTYNWFTSSAGGTPFYTGSSYTTPSLTGSTTYYIQSVSAAGCISSSMATAIVTVASGLTPPTANNAQICSGQSATLSVNNPDPALTYNWYNTATGGTSFYTGPSYTTPVLTASATYYIESSNSAGCISASRTAVTVTILAALPAPTVNNASICSSQSATLSINNPDPALTYSWYTAATGGTAFYTGTSYTTPVLTSSATYYIESSNSAGCISASRTAVTVTILAALPAPTVNNASICSGQSATLSINNPDPALTYSWYTAATGGTAFYTGTSYTTPVLTSSVTYYIDAKNSGGCISASRTPVTATILAALPAPSVNSVSICSGQSATLSISNPDPLLTYTWYTAATGGTAFYTGTSYTTPVLTSSVTYYIDAKNSGGCISASRTPVTATILPALSAPSVNNSSVCTGQSAVLSVNNPDATLIYSWYTSSTAVTPVYAGVTYTTPVLTSNTNYYIQSSNSGGCKSALATVTVTISPALNNPVVPGIEVCSGATGMLSISNPVAGNIYTWYNNSSGGTPLTTGVTYQPPASSADATYYVQASNASGCKSGFTPVKVTVIPALQLPNALPVTICFNNTAALAVTNPQSGITYNWYSASTGGNSIATGINYTTPVLISTTVYYIEAVNTKGCKSTRSPVTVTVTPDIAAPIITPPDICYGTAALLTVSNPVSGFTYKWYSTITLGSPIATGITYTSPTLLTTTIYYVQATSPAGCKSAIGNAKVNVLPSVPVPSVFPVIICKGQSASLTINNSQPGLSYSWYNTSTAGSPVATGTTFQTPSLNTNTTYYVQSTTGAGCVSPRTSVIVTTLPSLPIPSISRDTICPGQVGVLNIINPQTGLTYNWYTLQTGGTLITTGINFSTPKITATTTYYVDATNAGGCSSVRTPATVTVKVAPKVSFSINPHEGCDPLHVIFTNTSQNATSYFWTFGDGGTSNDTNPKRIYHAGQYDVTLIATANGCADTLSKLNAINVVPPPVANFTSTPGTLNSTELRFATFGFQNHSKNATSYTWNFGDGSTSSFTQPSHKFSKTGSYRVSLYARNSYGCVDSSFKFYYKVIPDSVMNVPNAFSPNGDGVNDTWIIRGISGYTNATVSIFNRWGSLVYTSYGSYKPWNGLHNKSSLQTGTFYYVIQLTPLDKPVVGWLMLIK